MEIIEKIFAGASKGATDFGQLLVSGAEAVTKIFWNGESLTIIGVLSTVALGVGVVYMMFNLLRRLVKVRG